MTLISDTFQLLISDFWTVALKGTVMLNRGGICPFVLLLVGTLVTPSAPSSRLSLLWGPFRPKSYLRSPNPIKTD